MQEESYPSSPVDTAVSKFTFKFLCESNIMVMSKKVTLGIELEIILF